MDHYRQQFSAEGHRLGGYPYLTQQDLREDDSEKILLFQLDSDDEMEISWGDNGIAHFFVHPGMPP